jgi:nitrite reductase (NO-forming)
MKFGAPPATVSNEQHTDAFSQGDALSPDPTLRSLTQGNPKEIRLDTTHKIIEIALRGEVKFSAWMLVTRCRDPSCAHSLAIVPVINDQPLR